MTNSLLRRFGAAAFAVVAFFCVASRWIVGSFLFVASLSTHFFFTGTSVVEGASSNAYVNFASPAFCVRSEVTSPLYEMFTQCAVVSE